MHTWHNSYFTNTSSYEVREQELGFKSLKKNFTHTYTQIQTKVEFLSQIINKLYKKKKTLKMC